LKKKGHGVFAFEWVHARYNGDYKAYPNLTAWWARICEAARGA